MMARRATNEAGHAGGQAGFTIAELVLVLGVFLVLIGIVVVSVGGIESGTEDRDCRTELRALKAATETFKSNVGFYPPDDQALDDSGILRLGKSPNFDVSLDPDGKPQFNAVGSCDL